jgi:hypothetical protein
MNVVLIRFIHGQSCCGSYASFVVKVPIVQDTYEMPHPRCALIVGAELEISGFPQRTWEPA